MSILKAIFIFLEVLLLFNLLIFVHELGHFLAARWRGLKIDRFAIWFGKPIWMTKINGVDYALGTILAVDGKPVTKFSGMGDSVMWRIVSSVKEVVPVRVERDGKVLDLYPKPSKEPTKIWERK